MAPRPILVDTTRLLTRLRHASPSGIDRVDLAYARRFLTGEPDRRAVAIGPLGPRLMPEMACRTLLDTIETRWREDLPAERDPVLADVHEFLAGRRAEKRDGPPPGARRFGAADLLRTLAGLHWRRAVEAPRDAVYLHTSHLRLDRPEHFAWLAERRDVRPVFFIHDLIPIDFPEYVVSGEDARHRTRMATVARHAAAVIVNSADVGSRFSAHLDVAGLKAPPVTVAPLAVEDAFRAGGRRNAQGRPYLVVCSTIEARKNHLMLLQVWRELARQLGPETPALVIVGRRGWESEAAVDLLDRCQALRGHVIEAGGLSTAGLAELLAGARALLMPSFAEGYGIPIVEALSVGAPVVASDIPVHREVAGRHATFVDPLDGPAWAREIMRAADEPPTRAPSGYLSPTWAAHFTIVDQVLAGL